MPVHVIPEEGKSVRQKKQYENSSDLTHLNKYSDVEKSAYDRVFNALKKLDI